MANYNVVWRTNYWTPFVSVEHARSALEAMRYYVAEQDGKLMVGGGYNDEKYRSTDPETVIEGMGIMTFLEVFGQEAEDSGDPIDITALIDYYAKAGELVVLLESGYEKLRYVSGDAVAWRAGSDEAVHLGLNDIYAMAEAKFGTRPTPAEY